MSEIPRADEIQQAIALLKAAGYTIKASRAMRLHGPGWKDLIGAKFGRLTVLSEAEVRKGEQFWNCKCECGNTSVHRGTHLRGGRILSCGCLRGITGGGFGAYQRKLARKKCAAQ